MARRFDTCIYRSATTLKWIFVLHFRFEAMVILPTTVGSIPVYHIIVYLWPFLGVFCDATRWLEKGRFGSCRAITSQDWVCSGAYCGCLISLGFGKLWFWVNTLGSSSPGKEDAVVGEHHCHRVCAWFAAIFRFISTCQRHPHEFQRRVQRLHYNNMVSPW